MSETTTDDATSEDTTEQGTTAEVETTAETDTTEGESALGDAGKKALDAMKAEKKAAVAEARHARTALEKLQAELALKDKPADEQAIEAAKAEARAETLTAANARILKSELRAAATGKLADPTDAALYIDLSEFDVNDDGDVDSDALTEAIADLLERKPHLAAGKPNRFDGAADQGAKGKDVTPPQWTNADLERHKDDPDAITAAKAAGLLKDILGTKS